MWNPGNMPQEVKVKDLFKKHVSKPRNPNIANVFFKSGYVESWGRGYYNIELAKKWNIDGKLRRTREAVRENLKKLQELGLIRRVGARKNGHWELTKQ